MGGLESLISNRILLTFLVSMVPVLELRAAIPLGVSAGLKPLEAMAISIVGNLVPVPFILLFVRRVFDWLQDKSPRLHRFVERMESRAEKKKGLIKKWELLGLAILVAVPLPGTGAWTGALVAALMDIRMKRAFPAIALGVLVAGMIVTAITYGASSLF